MKSSDSESSHIDRKKIYEKCARGERLSFNVRAIAPFTRSLRLHFTRDVVLENVGFEELHFLYGKTRHALELFKLRVVLRGVFLRVVSVLNIVSLLQAASQSC